MPTETTSKPPVLPLVAIGLIVLGAIGPWVTASELDLSESGLESDGVITLALALVTAGTLLFVKRSMTRLIVCGICAVLILVIAIIDVLDVLGTSALGIEPSVGWGLWLTLVGAILLDAAVILAFVRRSSAVTA